MKAILLLYSILYFSSLSLFAQQDVNILLIARNTGSKVLANQDTIRIFGFAEDLLENPGVPGPTITVNEGDSVHIDLWNVSQGAPHTIHLHGLDVDQQNDGVPHLSFNVPHMAHGFYHFKAPHPGTYLYHCHVASTIHVQAGMYGLIIVKPSNGSNTTWDNGYLFDHDFPFFMSEIDTNWHTDSVLMHDHDTSMTVHTVEIPNFAPQFFLINGLSDQQLVNENVSFNSSINAVNYVRLANIGYYGTRIIFPPGLNAKIIDSDGRPLNVEEISDTVYVFPGERYGVLTQATTEFSGEIQFEYINLNTMEVKNTQVVPVTISGYVGLSEQDEPSFRFDISPNPFRENSTLEFELTKSKYVEIGVYDMNGKRVSELDLKTYSAGKHIISLDHLIPSRGQFIIKLDMNGTSYSEKVMRQ